MFVLRWITWLWQQRKQNKLLAIAIIAVLIAFTAFTLAVLRLGWNWTGFNGGYSQVTTTSSSHGTTTTTVQQPSRTLWDLLQLLIVPIILAIGGFWLNNLQKSREKKTTEQRAEIEKKAAEKRAKDEQEIATDNQREAALQAYIDGISELLLHEGLSEADDYKADADDSEIYAEFEDKVKYAEDHKGVRRIARVRTLTALSRLDAGRKGTVLLFLFESGLILRNQRSVDLSGADLNEVTIPTVPYQKRNLTEIYLCRAYVNKASFVNTNLSGATLIETVLAEANLSQVNLHKADLSRAILTSANLTSTDLTEATLTNTYFAGADLSSANLCGVDLRQAVLNEANLAGANLKGAKITEEQLKKVKSLKGATMPDGTKHP